MSVAFRIRRSDLKRFFDLVEKEAPIKERDWLVFIKVMDYTADFYAGGARAEYPVLAISQGSVQVVRHALKSAIEGSKSKEVEILLGDGFVTCGKKSIGDESVSIGVRPLGADSLTIYPTFLELIVLSRTLDEEATHELELEQRLKDAKFSMEVKRLMRLKA
jgi:hypothetical protein